ncbi:tyrosyl-DNA phosphodiesterase-domain-containing protein [Umbelopsis sp. PMI_123]|nr:tyrosyl-DNA phosphodiesterase-domain-containing protein [Umbelopsis sp. PMI_123]
MSIKRTREENQHVEIDLNEPVTKRTISNRLEIAPEIAGSTGHSHYVDSGINLTYSSGCTDEENFDTVTLRDIIGDENLQELYQFNFTVDLQYLMENLADSVRSSAKIKVIHGMKESIPIIEAAALTYSNVEIYSPKMMDRWGVHHSKCMVLFCQKNAIQYVKIAIVTANICYSDWNEMCQATYRTPILNLKSKSTVPGELIGSEHGSPFERDLISYFRAYNTEVTNGLCEKLQLYDFSKCKAVVIASVPGYHQSADMQKWGYKRLQHVLTKKVDIVPECQKQSIILTQALLENLQKSGIQNNLLHACEVAATLCRVAYRKLNLFTLLLKSITGLESAGFLRMDAATYQNLHPWFPKYLCKWAGKIGGREKVMPHYKSYTRLRVNQDTKTDSIGGETEARASIAWHMITSANLSRAAWGDSQKNGTQLHIRHYELGILLYPDLWEEQETHMLAANYRNANPNPPDFVSIKEGDTIVPVRIPYGLPPRYYTSSDHCWSTAFVE